MGVISDKCGRNCQIRYDNKLINHLEKHTQKLLDAIKQSMPNIAEVLETLKNYKLKILSKLSCGENEVKNITKKFDDIKSIAETLESQNQILNSQKEEYKSEFNKIKEENTQFVDKEHDSIRDKIREKMFEGIDNKDLF